jgi:hypothetical protein
MRIYSNPKEFKPSEPAVWLQEIGWVEAKPAKDLVPGEKRIYNCGYRYIIGSVVNNGKFVSLSIVNSNGTNYIEKKRPNTLVPFER